MRENLYHNSYFRQIGTSSSISTWGLKGGTSQATGIAYLKSRISNQIEKEI